MVNNKNHSRSIFFKRDLKAWLALLTLIMAVIFGLDPARQFFQKKTETARQFTPSDHPRFAILTYGRLVKEPDGHNITSIELEKQISALRSNNYTFIRLSDIDKFYHENGKLPDRAVALVFNFGYLDTYALAEPILTRYGISASISLVTKKQQIRDTTYLYWDRLKKMTESGHWEILTAGHASTEDIDIDDAENKGKFTLSSLWLKQKTRLETAQESNTRVALDILESREFLASKSISTDYYIFPYKLALERRQKILEGLENKIRIAIDDDVVGTNDEQSDPLNLHSFRIESDLDRNKLVDRLQALFSTNRVSLTEKSHFIQGDGRNANINPSIKLSQNDQSSVWVAGSQWASCWMLGATISVKSGQFWIRQDYDSSPQGWRIGSDGDYTYIQTHSVRKGTNTIRQTPGNTFGPDFVRILLMKRGSGVWIEWQGRPLYELPLGLEYNGRGTIGMSVWSKDGQASAEISYMEFKPFDCGSMEISSSPSAKDIQELQQNMPYISTLIVPRFQIDATGLTEKPVDNDLINAISTRFAVGIVPSIDIGYWTSPKSVPDFDKISMPDVIVSKFIEEKWEGIKLTLPGEPYKGDGESAFANALRTAYFHRTGKKWMNILSSSKPPLVSTELNVE